MILMKHMKEAIEIEGVNYENNNDYIGDNIVFEVIEEPAVKKRYIGNN